MENLYNLRPKWKYFCTRLIFQDKKCDVLMKAIFLTLWQQQLLLCNNGSNYIWTTRNATRRKRSGSREEEVLSDSVFSSSHPMLKHVHLEGQRFSQTSQNFIVHLQNAQIWFFDLTFFSDPLAMFVFTKNVCVCFEWVCVLNECVSSLIRLCDVNLQCVQTLRINWLV